MRTVWIVLLIASCGVLPACRRSAEIVEPGPDPATEARDVQPPAPAGDSGSEDVADAEPADREEAAEPSPPNSGGTVTRPTSSDDPEYLDVPHALEPPGPKPSAMVPKNGGHFVTLPDVLRIDITGDVGNRKRVFWVREIPGYMDSELAARYVREPYRLCVFDDATVEYRDDNFRYYRSTLSAEELDAFKDLAKSGDLADHPNQRLELGILDAGMTIFGAFRDGKSHEVGYPGRIIGDAALVALMEYSHPAATPYRP